MIVEYRYGLTGQTPMTLNDIGKKLDLSRERVLQIEERALLRLRRVAAKMGLMSSAAGRTTQTCSPAGSSPKPRRISWATPSPPSRTPRASRAGRNKKAT